MQEFERQQYLALMGIQSWMPRRPLPYGPPSVYIPLFDPELLDQQAVPNSDGLSLACKAVITETNPAETTITETAVTETTLCEKTMAETESIAESGDVTAPSEATDTAPTANNLSNSIEKPAEQVQPWQFSFLIWKDKLLCIQSLQQGEAAQLAQAILGAVTGCYEHRLAQHQWPLYAQEPLESAKTRLSVFMKTLRSKVKVVLCFGTLETQVFRPLLGSDWLAAHQRCITLPSLAAMLADPLQKSVAWKQLKPLFLSKPYI